MDNTVHPDPPIGLGLGTFHTTFFILILVLLLYFAGNLGPLLAGLNTLIGFALFLVLWGTTLWTTGQALRMLAAKQSYRIALFEQPIRMRKALSLGLLWGGINGSLFSLVLLFAIAISLSPAALVYGLVVIPVAFIAGALSGMIVTILDSVLLFLAGIIK